MPCFCDTLGKPPITNSDSEAGPSKKSHTLDGPAARAGTTRHVQLRSYLVGKPISQVSHQVPGTSYLVQVVPYRRPEESLNFLEISPRFGTPGVRSTPLRLCHTTLMLALLFSSPTSTGNLHLVLSLLDHHHVHPGLGLWLILFPRTDSAAPSTPTP